MSQVSPLLYVGGKTRKVKIFDKIVKDYFDITDKKLVSPFCGGSSFEIYMANHNNMNVICCDIDKRLCDFWNTMKTDRQNLIKESKKLLPLNKENYVQYYNKSFQENITNLERASLYYVLNRGSYCGKMTCAKDYRTSSFKTFTTDKVDKLNNINLDNMEFKLKDCKETLQDYNDVEKTIFYLDPPYFNDYNKLYGKGGQAHQQFDHYELCEVLKNCNNWVMSYNDCEKLREMYSDFKIVDVAFQYGCGGNFKVNELLIVKDW